ncbi:uncharacterized protein LOC128682443 isoform X1 [Plodia interpunctella]|uniref:uncharacterized protein LOC128682443 isoform X1 n=1 Tax=Plodia interpunctella TaxID=58824 RepID=UPI0023680F47|nr:uncharacterized protein LOC128682443 isoform X1 [Plodia interpunctella]
MCSLKLVVFVLFVSMYLEVNAKLSDGESSEGAPEVQQPHQKLPRIHMPESGAGPALMFADELKITLEKYLFGLCPQTFKSRWLQTLAKKNGTNLVTCDLDPEQQDLAGRLATLALRAHSASRTDCLRFGSALANTLGELARTAANRAALNISSSEANKKRKLSKSQKAKIQAKQRTALAVKKKAAAAAAAAAAKMAAS